MITLSINQQPNKFVNPNSNEDKPETGKRYDINHERFGKAGVRVLKMDDTWADCQVLKGILRGLGQEAVWGPGQIKTVRISHCKWNQSK